MDQLSGLCSAKFVKLLLLRTCSSSCTCARRDVGAAF